MSKRVKDKDYIWEVNLQEDLDRDLERRFKLTWSDYSLGIKLGLLVGGLVALKYLGVYLFS